MSPGSAIRRAVPEDAEALGTIQAESHQATDRGVMPDSVLARLGAERLIERFRTRLVAAADAPADDQRRCGDRAR